MMDRSIMPSFGKITKIDLMEPKVHHLDNGLPVFCVDAGTQEVLKVEAVFHCGTSTADKKLVASATSKLLTEGTAKHSAQEIAESVDFYGAHLQTEMSHDESSVSLFTLSKHLKETVGTLAEVYENPIFPQREVETYLLKNRQELLVNEEKVSYLAAKAFNAALFGAEHPYGRSAELNDYAQVTRQELVDFHAGHILDRIQYILVSGKLSDTTVAELNGVFGQRKRQPVTETTVSIGTSATGHVHSDKADAVQNAIRIGRVLFNRTHADYIGMQILATVLGGYFGSRLMANIREDKGYTYGVGAGMVSLKNSGYLSISTEVGADVCASAISEIQFEIEQLRKHLIPTDELELVRNYMLGSILKGIDGPFQTADKWKTYLRYGLGLRSHHELIRQIQTITSERLRELANTYLQREDLIQVTAGRTM